MGGAYYLRRMLNSDRTLGDIRLALYQYNAGPGGMGDYYNYGKGYGKNVKNDALSYPDKVLYHAEIYKKMMEREQGAEKSGEVEKKKKVLEDFYDMIRNHNVDKGKESCTWGSKKLAEQLKKIEKNN